MKIFFTTIVVLVIIFSACNKYQDLKDNAEVTDTCTIRGRLFLLDTLTQQAINLPQASKKVFLYYADASDTTNYLYSTTTDGDGYFSFKNLKAKRLYRAVYEEKISEKIFRADDTVKAPNSSFVLTANLAKDKQGGIILRVYDPIGQTAGKATVCFFNTAGAYSGGKCENSVVQVTADTYGRAVVTPLKPGTFYLITTATIGAITYMARDTITVGNKIDTFNINLVAVRQTGVQYLVLDQAGNKLAGAQVCLFTSNTFFARDTCEGSNYSDSSNAVGTVNFTGLTPSKFYTLANLRIGNRTYRYKDSIMIQEGTVVKDTLWLQ